LNAFSLAIFVAGLAPIAVASFIYLPFATPLIEPHWFSFSSFGFFLMVSNGLVSVTKKMRGWLGAVLISSLLLTSLLTVREANTKWRDQETYCRYWLSLNVHNLTPYYGLGKSRLEKGDCVEAIQLFERGLLFSKYSHEQLSTDLGIAYACVGSDERAAKAYNGALKINSRYSVAHHHQALLALKHGAHREALLGFSNALRMNARSESSYEYLLAVRAEIEGRMDEARNRYRVISVRYSRDDISRQKMMELGVRQSPQGPSGPFEP
ncbi:MAG: tetratricopeptide repeat protein, partial [Acidobacteriota bacterium]